MRILRALLVGGVLGTLLTAHVAAASPTPSTGSTTPSTSPIYGYPSASPPTPTASPVPTPTPTPSPSPTPSPTPTPINAQLDVSPLEGVSGSTIQVTGSRFLPNESVTLLWDNLSDKSLGVETADATGTFSASVTLPADSPGSHTIYAKEVQNAHVNFLLQSPQPSPTVSQSLEVSPSPTDTGIPPGVTIQAGSGDGGPGLSFLTRPPFVFFPLLLILGIAGAVAYTINSRRKPRPRPGTKYASHASRTAGPAAWTPPRPPSMADSPSPPSPPAIVPPAPEPSPPGPASGPAWPSEPNWPPEPTWPPKPSEPPPPQD
ncbi:MAG TPA: hypothetical protein VG015_09430 [Candidatus Dormibacteraeota bacterium]|nr:hypothetical protein [Candidatus Dormibacteraeota bacterium]